MVKPDMTNSSSFPAGEPSINDPRVLREDAFRQILALERKRSERSGKPLLLLLVDVSRLAGEQDGSREVATLLRELAGLIREIDQCGWYREGALVAVLFAEIPADAVATARDALGTKIRERLATVFVPEVYSRITLTFLLFPEKYAGEGAPDAFALSFYPELVSVDPAESRALKIKRGMDLVGSLAALLFLSPVFLVIAVLIKVTSPGPVFFRQERLGRFGRTFTFLKFRSMKVNNDDAIHRQFIKEFIADKVDAGGSGSEAVVYKIQRDPRLTPIGNFLRKSSLDELPQFLNVLKGDMSLVGPRPPIPYEVVDYEVWHRRRVLAQKPGITGLWQVTGRSLTTFDGMVRLDLQYLRTWSLWLDIRLLLATPVAVLRGKGAY